jgi:hypothetical protein
VGLGGRNRRAASAPERAGRALPSRSSRYWKESRRATLRLEISSRDVSRRELSAPISRIRISRSRGTLVARIAARSPSRPTNSERRYKNDHAGGFRLAPMLKLLSSGSTGLQEL